MSSWDKAIWDVINLRVLGKFMVHLVKVLLLPLAANSLPELRFALFKIIWHLPYLRRGFGFKRVLLDIVFVIAQILKCERLLKDERPPPAPWVNSFVGQMVIRVVVETHDRIIFQRGLLIRLPLARWLLSTYYIRLVHVLVQLIRSLRVVILLAQAVLVLNFPGVDPHGVGVTILLVAVFQSWVQPLFVHFFNFGFDF